MLNNKYRVPFTPKAKYKNLCGIAYQVWAGTAAEAIRKGKNNLTAEGYTIDHFNAVKVSHVTMLEEGTV